MQKVLYAGSGRDAIWDADKFGVGRGMPTLGKPAQVLIVKLTSRMLKKEALFSKQLPNVLAGRRLRTESCTVRALPTVLR